MSENTNLRSLINVMEVFFKDPGDHFDALSEMVARFDCEILDDHEEAQSLIPVGEAANEQCHICYTEFDFAPYLIATTAPARLVKGEDKQLINFQTRRIAMLEVNEEDIFEWLCDLSNTDPVRNNEDGGSHSWFWSLPPKDDVIADGFRLFSAPSEGMLVLDRIATVKMPAQSSVN